MNVKQLCDVIDRRKDELFEMLGSFIRINTENFINSGNEKELSEYIHKMCIDLGLESEMYSPMDLPGFSEHPDYIQNHGLEDRFNVTARWTGAENRDELMLMGHLDTVQIGDLNNWEKDPLSGEVSDGKIWGRGAGDNKYALATILFLIKVLKDEGFIPKANLLFSAYVDEEYGGSHGALAAVLKDPCPKIVSMDGVEGQIWHCGSGGQEAKYLFHTKELVDSAKTTAMAVPIILEEMEKFAENRKKELEENRFYKGTIIPETSLRYMGVRAGYDGVDLGCGEAYFVYYTDKTKEEIYAEFAELEKSIAKRLEPLGIIGDGFRDNTRFFHYVFCEPDSEDVENMLIASKEATGKDIIVCGSCLSDLSVISKYGSSNAYGFGMGRDFSEPGGAHQPNEYIECDKFVDYTKTIGAYILRVLG